jgi:hypothetical protein
MQDGSGKWRPSQWEALLARALEALDSLGGAAGFWTFGGGNALAQDLGQRVSYDVDVFLDSHRALRLLAPNVNPVTKAICDTWQWQGAYLKLIVKDVGGIDFLNSSAFTDDPTTDFGFRERVIPRERPAEVIAKKLIYRASTFKKRDMFDLAGTWLFARDEVLKAAGTPYVTADRIKAAINRIELGQGLFQSQMRRDVNPTERGETFIDQACEIALEALREMQRVPRSGFDDAPPPPR